MGLKQRSDASPMLAEKEIGKATQTLYLPVRVLFEDESGNLTQEITKTNYISATQAVIQLSRKLPMGMVLRLALPLPVSWRKHSFTETVYVTPAEITGIQSEGAIYHTHFKFLSDREAIRRRKEYEDAKGRTSEMSPKLIQTERRNDARYEIPIEMKLEVLNDFGAVIATEQTVTENISRGGARLMTGCQVRQGDIVRVTAVREEFKTRAVVKRTYIAADRVRRINIQFMDEQWKV